MKSSASFAPVRNLFVTPDEAAAIIQGGAIALFAGSEAALAALPRGEWIGGTTVYFMTSEGGAVNTERLYCTLIDEAVDCRCAYFAAPDVGALTAGQFAHGFTYIMVPAFSQAHQHYAVEAPSFSELYNQPVMGWVTGVAVAEIGIRRPKAFFGPTDEVFEDALLAMYIRLPETISAVIDTVNLFTQGYGPEIIFPRTGFIANDCLIDGIAARIGHYLAECDTQLPLVADYAGIMMNVGVQTIDAASGGAQFYAPVVAGETYRLARPVEDYRAAYRHGAAAITPPETVLSCNCVLNYLYAGLEGKSAGGYVGPVTFSEIAYILVNQTLVRLSLTHDAGSSGVSGALAEELRG